MKRIKTYGIVALAVIFLVIVFQNTEVVEIRILMWKVSMSRALLLPLILLFGFGTGVLYSGLHRKKDE